MLITPGFDRVDRMMFVSYNKKILDQGKLLKHSTH